MLEKVISANKGTYKSLTAVQKESIGLLSIGTFLEYFDLFLYVHMAVFLNEIFFPKTDPHTAALLTAFAFCSTYVLRPVGALIFGYIGDHIGRKATVTITTTLMAVSCLVMANLPTYAQIGIFAAYIVTIVRILQGMSSMGEVIGAELYLTEATKPPIQYTVVSAMAMFGALGGSAALGFASLVTDLGFDWRLAFWFGSIVAIIGGIARRRMQETPEFLAAKQKRKEKVAQAKDIHTGVAGDPTTKVNNVTAVALFCIHASWPVCFYFAYMYCGNILKDTYNLTATEIIHQNFIVSMLQLFSWSTMAVMSYWINPIKIVKARLIFFMIFILFSPYLFSNAASAFDILIIQSCIVVFGFTGNPAIPICYKHFPVFKRFTSAAFAYALSRAVVYIFTSFGLVYLAEIFNVWVALVVMVPVAIIFAYSILHFEKLEKADNIISDEVHESVRLTFKQQINSTSL